ncbi:hypothetical protein K227x_47830 [Rubripirellula lacrimiformis]|uniref:Uncharacterized protein n=1 Tax=Rubripirellula lacrimiformis TaxID=1930273 RepID=A0A517NGW9_9BACT|nr:tetratricopeptide repeat protein [Rubripirellula lacrimiformis]QDT06374.1 hypothetical protein K227x_47830 [Rubripirellula lacrimiformis]
MNDRRHELQQNDLAIWLHRVNQAIEPHSRLIAIVVGGLIVAGIGWMLYTSQQTGQRSDATLNLIEAMNSPDTEVLESVSQDFAGTLAAEWAKIYQANQFLSDGVDSLFTDRDNAVTLLEDAKIAYENALAGSKDPLLLSRGHFGLARAHESLGELDEAIEEYKKTIGIGESKQMTEICEDRIADLGKPGTKDFLAWFADQDFSPADPSLPPALPGSSALPDLPDLDLPDLNLPGGGNSDVMEAEDGLELPADDGAETGVKETEAAETDSPAETKPAETDSTESDAAGTEKAEAASDE